MLGSNSEIVVIEMPDFDVWPLVRARFDTQALFLNVTGHLLEYGKVGNLLMKKIERNIEKERPFQWKVRG